MPLLFFIFVPINASFAHCAIAAKAPGQPIYRHPTNRAVAHFGSPLSTFAHLLKLGYRVAGHCLAFLFGKCGSLQKCVGGLLPNHPRNPVSPGQRDPTEVFTVSLPVRRIIKTFTPSGDRLSIVSGIIALAPCRNHGQNFQMPNKQINAKSPVTSHCTAPEPSSYLGTPGSLLKANCSYSRSES